LIYIVASYKQIANINNNNNNNNNNSNNMETNDDILPSNSSANPSSLLNNNITPTNVLSAPSVDEVSAVSANFFSSVRTRTLVDSGVIYDAKPKNTSIPEQMGMDFSRILNKPFLVGKFNWSTSDTRHSCPVDLSLPSAILTNLPCGASLRVPFDAAALYRANLKIILQVSGTPMHQGTLLVTSIPKGCSLTTVSGNLSSRLSTYMAAPHTFLYANGSSSVSLEVPFYANTKFLATDLNLTALTNDAYNGDYASLRAIVLNPLVPPTNGNSTLTVAIYVMFDDAQFFVPHSAVRFEAQSKVVSGLIDNLTHKTKQMAEDFIDSARVVLKDYTGLHNKNHPVPINRMIASDRNNFNLVDYDTNFEKLDPFSEFTRVCAEPLFETKQDEMMLSYILSKPQYLGTFKVNTSTTAGKVVWSRPITPLQEATVENETVLYSTPLCILSLLSKYWKGSMNIHVQSNMTNFHFCKLVVARDYSPVSTSLTKVPVLDDVANLLVENIEFSGGGQVQTIVMPYMSIFDQLEITTDYPLNAVQHGMYYVYLDQPLVTNGTVSSEVEFNVYVSAGDDFQLFGYSINNYNMKTLIDPVPAFEGQSLLNTSASDGSLMARTGKTTAPKIFNDNFHHNSSIRDYIRRFYPVIQHPLSVEAGTPTFLSVSDLLGLTSHYQDAYNPLDIINQLYLGFTGGLKFKIRLNGASDASVMYIPPQMRLLADSSGFIKTVPSDVFLQTVDADTAIVNNSVLSSTIYNAPILYPTVAIETSTKPVLMSARNAVLEIEGVVPNMSPFRFVGDLKNHTNATVQKFTSNIDLGTLVISITARTAGEPAVGVFFAACSDESRFGFQVCTPAIYINNFISSSGPHLQLVSANSDYASIYTPYSNPQVRAPACYITNT
jgi:hypothetical protein